MAYVATRPRPSAPSDGSRTITLNETQSGEEGTLSEAGGESIGRLRLRGATRTHQRVVWREDVVDNEGAGKKSSKICCIYHKPRRFDESSSEESSSDSDSGSDSSCNHNRPTHRKRTRRLPPDQSGEGGEATRSSEGESTVHTLQASSDEANTYERLPGSKHAHPHSKGKKPLRPNNN
ncbi:uncharacterized protein LAESUDRAFT_685741 [Laetiporus sulphureus 93-53]|uniref:Type 1 phosphatases regulator n=1 Tax=Laetiporus sulphureus 93-53 TaxID=1314785 RepID=A0A165C5Y5_9APHY|nr:uncharacterized protein LAESUDRAFT_685741 [Laetiporus sulphureus 93-53]KZT02262.1 hypothetical protein LAESUDRAFT_685741 [Laetiporus sulphureus 93-53]